MIFLWFSFFVFYYIICIGDIYMKYKSGEQFLNKLYSNMYLEEGVSKYASAGDKPEDVISKYLCKLEKVHEMAKGVKGKWIF